MSAIPGFASISVSRISARCASDSRHLWLSIPIPRDNFPEPCATSPARRSLPPKTCRRSRSASSSSTRPKSISPTKKEYSSPGCLPTSPCAWSNSMALIQIQGLRKRFEDGDVIQGIDLSIEGGEIFGLIGPDGAGKSTLIRMLAGILEPSQGKISLRGINAIADYEEVRDLVGYMPQTFGLYGPLTVEENLRAVARIHGVRSAEFKKRVERLYQFSGLGPFRGRRA